MENDADEQLNDLSKPQDIGGVLKFESNKQQKIHEELGRLDPKRGRRIATIYEGILLTSANKSHPDRIAQASHSVRELANIVPRFKAGLPEKSKTLDDLLRDKSGWNDLFSWIDNPKEVIPESAKKIIETIKSLFTQQSASEKIAKGLIDAHPNRPSLPDYLQNGLVREWARLHKWFTTISHYPDLKNDESDPITESEFEINLRQFEDLLYRILCPVPFFESIEEIDKLLKIEKPTETDVTTLIRLISHPNHQRYFFERCDNPEWLDLLKQKGAFKNPQEPLRKDGYVQFIPWPQSVYLSKMATHKPKEVFDVIKGLDTENQTILANFMDAGLNSPVDVAASYAELVVRKKWIQNPYNFILPDKIGDLIEKLALGEKFKEALSLVRTVFDTKVDEPARVSDNPNDPFQFIHHDAKAYFDDWRLGEIAKDKLKELASKDPIGLFETLASRLHHAVELENRTDDEDPLRDYSYIWRPNLWTPRHSREDAKNIILDSMMSLVQSNKENIPVLKKVLEVLKKHKWAIFRRMEMAIYVLDPTSFKDEVILILTDRSMMVRSNMRREYLPLLGKAYKDLSSEAQRKILESIELGPDMQKPDDMSEEVFARIQSEWKSRYMDTIKDYLPKDELKAQEEYVSKHGKPFDDDGEIHEWTGGGSPIGTNDLAAFGVQGVIKYLEDYKGSDDPFERYSSNGLGMTFSEVVKSNPEEYASVALSLLEHKVRPIYLYHYLNGLKEALKQNMCFAWEPVIDLCHRVTHLSKHEIPEPKSEREQDFESVKRAISDFLNEALRTDVCEIPIALKIKVWETLSKLSEDPDPTPERESADGGGNLDPLTTAINSIRGETMHAVINYGLWNARQTSPDSSKRMPVELKDLLEKHLDMSNEPSPAVRSVYGWRLPNIYYLSEEWLIKNKSRIFDQNSKEHLLAAWAGYLANGVIREVFDLLKEEHRSFIPYLGTIEKTGYRSSDIEEKFPQHLMIAYCHDPKHDDLITDFFTLAPGKSKGQAINFCGRVVLREVGRLSNGSEIKKRLRELWDSRLSVSPEIVSVEEFQEFGWWFKQSPFERKETLERMTKTLELTKGKIDVPYEIAEELVGYVAEFPLESIKILDLLARAEKEAHEISYKRNEYREIIKAVKGSGNTEAIDISNSLIHYFGEQGFFDDFRDLL